jgi:uncharacterized membrane protein YccC
LAGVLRPWVPAFLFGLRVWAAVCLALYVAFLLELDDAYWAGVSAAIVCLPSLGASLRKIWFYMVGTAVGAVAIVVLTACFPQNRIGFLLSLALWGAACGLVTTLLHNFAAYAAALAGFTAAIIANVELGATGGASGGVFMIAVTRASDVCIGIVCAGVVLVATDLGGARRRLAAQLAAISSEIADQFACTFTPAWPGEPETRAIRRDFIRRVIALDPVIDEVLGESSDLRPHSPVLRAAVAGLFAAISGWQAVALHLGLLPTDQGRREADLVQRNLPPQLHSASLRGETANWINDPSDVCEACRAAARTLAALPVPTPSFRLLTGRTAEALIGIERALNGLMLLVDPTRAIHVHRVARFHVPDLLPALVNAARVFVTIGAVELFWITTAWPNGAFAITFAALVVILLSARGDQAYAVAMTLVAVIGLNTVLAAIVKFAVLPGVESFAGFSLAIGLVVVPAGTVAAMRPAIGTIMTATAVLLLAPVNQMSYDTQQFYNAALSIIAGGLAGALALRLLPPVPPVLLTRRLLALTLRDLRCLATKPIPRTATDWKDRVYDRLSAMPERAGPLQRAQLLTALSTGIEIIRLRRITRQFNLDVELQPALNAVTRGDSLAALEWLGRLDRSLAALPIARLGGRNRLRARASILAISEASTRHAAYFDSGAA